MSTENRKPTEIDKELEAIKKRGEEANARYSELQNQRLEKEIKNMQSQITNMQLQTLSDLWNSIAAPRRNNQFVTDREKYDEIAFPLLKKLAIVIENQFPKAVLVLH
jgi:hypothetical protein